MFHYHFYVNVCLLFNYTQERLLHLLLLLGIGRVLQLQCYALIIFLGKMQHECRKSSLMCKHP